MVFGIICVLLLFGGGGAIVIGGLVIGIFYILGWVLLYMMICGYLFIFMPFHIFKSKKYKGKRKTKIFLMVIWIYCMCGGILLACAYFISII